MLSTSLGIAAIDLKISKLLAYDYELVMIGVSNLISGIIGGYSGIYVLSQVIFHYFWVSDHNYMVASLCSFRQCMW